MSQAQEKEAFERMFDWLPHMRFPAETPTNLRVSKLEKSSTRLVEVCGKSYLVWDNGGEVGVELLNSGRSDRFPMRWWSIALDSGTLAYRLCQVITGEPIDYDFRMDFDLAEIKATA